MVMWDSQCRHKGSYNIDQINTQTCESKKAKRPAEISLPAALF